MRLNLSAIKPKQRSISDKYSWDLYRFLHKLTKDKDHGEYVANNIQIYWLTRSKWDGAYLAFDDTKRLNRMNSLQVVISPSGGNRSGYFLSTIFNRGEKHLFSMSVYKEEEMIDITDWFFEQYELRGRCFFFDHDRNWMVGGEERFTYVNNTRKCNWCGEWQKKETITTKEIKRTDVWTKEEELT